MKLLRVRVTQSRAPQMDPFSELPGGTRVGAEVGLFSLMAFPTLLGGWDDSTIQGAGEEAHLPASQRILGPL
jgi:hypothetical protein